MEDIVKFDETKKLKEYLLSFITNSLNIKNKNFDEATQNPIIGSYLDKKIKARFGVGRFSKTPWFAFLAYNQEIQTGIYPVILFDTERQEKNFEICYGISETNIPQFVWLDVFTKNLTHSKSKKYNKSFVKKSYSINSLNDYKINEHQIIEDINCILNDYQENFKNPDLIKIGYQMSIFDFDKTKEKKLIDNIKDLYWYQAIALSMYMNGKDKTYKVKDLVNQPIIAKYATLKESQNVYLTLQGQLQIHTSIDSKTVNYTKKTPPAIFDKDENSEWYLTDEGINYIENNFAGTLQELGNPQLYKEKRVETHYWMLSAGEQAYMWDDFQQNSIIAVGWDDWNLGNLEQYKTKAEIQEKMIEYNPQTSNKNNALCLWQFANDMQVGDVVFIKGTQTSILGRGIIKSQYVYDEERNRYKHTRKIEWTHIGEWESATKWAIKTLTDITQYTEDVEKLENMFNVEVEEQVQDYDLYSEEDFLNDVFMDTKQYTTLKNLLLNKKNVILQGAPGVGKTYTAKRLCYSILGKMDTSKVEMIQFHQSYGYEDFIMGYRPSSNSFELKYGPFYNFCDKARKDLDNPYFFIIDEINRGKLSKIFGELLMLIEPDKRGQSLRLLYKDEQFSVPKNLHIIGMMNTADRSIAMIDYALRRRFAFYEFQPAFETDSFRNYKDKFNNPKYSALIDEIVRLNQVISEDSSLGTGFQIGHSYFCNTKAIDDEWLNSVVDYEIIPLLKEYWFDEENKVKEWTTRLKNAIR